MKSKLILLFTFFSFLSLTNVKSQDHESVYQRYAGPLAVMDGRSFVYNQNPQTSELGVKYLLWGNAVDAANTTKSFCLTGIANDGAVVWNKQISAGSENHTATRIIPTQDGGYIMIGNVLFGYNAPITIDINIYVLKVDQYFNTEWARRLGGSVYNFGYDIKEIRDGGYIIVGSSYNFSTAVDYDMLIFKLDSNGNTDWENVYSSPGKEEAHAVYETWDNQFIVTGYSTEGPGSKNTVALKINNQGILQWSKTIGNFGMEAEGHFIAYKHGSNPWQEYAICGYIDSGENPCDDELGDKDIHFIGINEYGDVLSSKVYGGYLDEEAQHFSVKYNHPRDPTDDAIFLTGYTKSFGAGKKDNYILEINAAGNLVNSVVFGEGEDEIGREIKLDGEQLNTIGTKYIYDPFGGTRRVAHFVGQQVIGQSEPFLECGTMVNFTQKEKPLMVNEFHLLTAQNIPTNEFDIEPSDKPASGDILCGAFPEGFSSEQNPMFRTTENENSDLLIHPNPSTPSQPNSITFDSKEKGNYKLELIDNTGKVLQEIEGKSIQGSNETTIDTSLLEPGIYLIQITQRQEIKTSKLVIVR